MNTHSRENRTHPNKRMYFDANTKGRDFVVGDLHGCFDDLNQALSMLNFDTTVDRLFCVGDLVDRGPDSLETAKLIYKDWFNCVKGNHEQLMIDVLVNEDRNMDAVWFQNGGDWMFSHDRGELTALARDMKSLPLVIVVGEGENRFNLVHAELTHRPEVDGHRSPVPVTDQMILEWPFDEYDEQSMVWGRTMVSLAQTLNVANGARFHSPDLSLTFVGHTPVNQNIMVERMMYIDNGAVFYHYHQNKSERYGLVLAEPNRKVLHKFSIMHRTMETIEFDTLMKYCQ